MSPQATQTGPAAAVAQTYAADQVDARAQAWESIAATWAALEAGQITTQWFQGAADRIFGLLGSLQVLFAQQATPFVQVALDVQGIEATVPQVNPMAFGGMASDGRDLESLLFLPVIRTAALLNRGADPAVAMQSGEELLSRIVQVQSADAARESAQVAIAGANADQGKGRSRSPIGWIRCLTLPSCSRCVLLAGKWYGWKEGFARHDGCDCRHIPATLAASSGLAVDPQAYFDSLSPEEQDQLFGVASSQAIRDGADLEAVVNATTRKGGVYTADDGRRYTREGTTKRGYYRSATELGRKGARRLTPQQVYREAKGDPAEAVRLLRAFGYIIG